MTTTLTQTTQAPAPAPQTANDRLDGQFDSAIGLPPQSQSPDYLTGYFGSGNVPF
ncbi:hypothetical protein [Anabaena sp. CCY 9402-a]|uniref:hypothetical protein n=1 Tax=Anabaena sp. CCY 9402-a TaxID=3103867 RepID=UPI0039C5B539